MKIIAYVGDAELLHPQCTVKLYGHKELDKIVAVFDYDYGNWHQQDENGNWVEIACGYCLNPLEDGPNYCTCGEIASVVETREGCSHVRGHKKGKKI